MYETTRKTCKPVNTLTINHMKPCIAVVGLGLMGGSLALTVKKKKLADKVIGLSRRESTVKKALDMGIVDEASTQPGLFLSQADYIFVSVPVRLTWTVIKQILPYVKKNAVISDLGSTKEKVVREVEKGVKDRFHFAGGHPLCGSDKSGVEFSNAHLYDGATYILTPTKSTHPAAFKKLKTFVKQLGANPVILAPKEHDMLLGQTSHFPHAVAFLLVKSLSQEKNRNEFFSYAASGFRDTTRVAGSPVDVWRDIFLHNRENLLKEVKHFKNNLNDFEKALRAKDEKALEKILSEGKAFRDAYEKYREQAGRRQQAG